MRFLRMDLVDGVEQAEAGDPVASGGEDPCGPGVEHHLALRRAGHALGRQPHRGADHPITSLGEVDLAERRRITGEGEEHVGELVVLVQRPACEHPEHRVGVEGAGQGDDDLLQVIAVEKPRGHRLAP